METANTPLWLMATIIVVGLIVISAILVYGINKRSADRNQTASDQLDVLRLLAEKAIESKRPMRLNELPYVDLPYVDAVVTDEPDKEANGQRPSHAAAAQRTS